jgi:L-asparaginase
MITRLKKLLKKSYLDKNIDFEIKAIISKDSLDIVDSDRLEITDFIARYYVQNPETNNKIVIIHGTDTMNETACYITEKGYISNIKGDYNITLTGSMIPFSIDTTEAIANLSLAVSNCLSTQGIFISMHGITSEFVSSENGTNFDIIKDKTNGFFKKGN